MLSIQIIEKSGKDLELKYQLYSKPKMKKVECKLYVDCILYFVFLFVFLKYKMWLLQKQAIPD